MKKANFRKFLPLSLTAEANSKIKGGALPPMPGWAANITGGGVSFWGYGGSNSDYAKPDGYCQYFFDDGRSLSGDCIS